MSRNRRNYFYAPYLAYLERPRYIGPRSEDWVVLAPAIEKELIKGKETDINKLKTYGNIIIIILLETRLTFLIISKNSKT